ncbi:AI-2E family transporter [Pleurocapsales cyanobacterium LEGE 06147]|nr:AI-2E family transporter [Pleurocapsales cyanobacterium LEGE 06147]
MKFSRSIGLLALIISLYILWQVRQLLLLAFTAIVLATALNKLVIQFQRWKIRRSLAVLLSLSILLVFLLIFLLLVVPPFVEQLQQLFKLLPTSIAEIQEIIEYLEIRFWGNLLPEIPDLEGLFQQIQPLIDRFLGLTVDIFTISLNILLQLLLVIVLTLMFLSSPRPYRHSFIRLFPSFYRQRVDEVLVRCEEALGNWTIGVLIEMVFIAAVSGISLWILQVPLALAHALIAGLLNLIPNLGPTLSVVFPMAIALLDAPWKALAVLILYIVIQQIESYWLTPTVMAKQVSLLPAITLLSQLFFASFFGFLGLLMALPLTIVIKTWLEELWFKDVLDKWKNPSSATSA